MSKASRSKASMSKANQPRKTLQGKARAPIYGDTMPRLSRLTKPEEIADGQDITLTWLTRDHGPQWETWRAYMAEYLVTLDRALGNVVNSLNRFCQRYLLALNLPPEPQWLLDRANVVPELFGAVWGKRTLHGVTANNNVVRFLSWVLVTHFSLPDDHGRLVVVSRFHNPGSSGSRVGDLRLSECLRPA